MTAPLRLRFDIKFFLSAALTSMAVMWLCGNVSNFDLRVWRLLDSLPLDRRRSNSATDSKFRLKRS
jgi:hypothetical protein